MDGYFHSVLKLLRRAPLGAAFPPGCFGSRGGLFYSHRPLTGLICTNRVEIFAWYWNPQNAMRARSENVPSGRMKSHMINLLSRMAEEVPCLRKHTSSLRRKYARANQKDLGNPTSPFLLACPVSSFATRRSPTCSRMAAICFRQSIWFRSAISQRSFSARQWVIPRPNNVTTAPARAPTAMINALSRVTLASRL